MTSEQHQDRVCEFVREIIAARTGEPLSITGCPDRSHRNAQAVEELWDSPSRRFAVEHTRIESYEGQLRNIKTVERLIAPVRERLAHRLGGHFVIGLNELETRNARVEPRTAQREIERLLLAAAPHMSEGDTKLLRSDRLPFEIELLLRHRRSSALVLLSNIDGDPDTLRLQRFRRAFDAKCPKLARWAPGRTSVLVLEGDDPQLLNYSLAFDAVEKVLSGRTDLPDVIVYVETDASPWSGWVFKDGERVGNAAMQTRDGGYLYERGRVR